MFEVADAMIEEIAELKAKIEKLEEECAKKETENMTLLEMHDEMETVIARCIKQFNTAGSEPDPYKAGFVAGMACILLETQMKKTLATIEEMYG